MRCIYVEGHTSYNYSEMYVVTSNLTSRYSNISLGSSELPVLQSLLSHREKMVPLLAYFIPFLVGSDCVLPPADNSGYFVISFTVFLGLGILPIGSAAGPSYVPKWKKQACEIPASRHTSSHYVCDEAGEVKCLPGWTGDLCDVPLCKKRCDPLQGYCQRPGECLCKLGFYGELCDKCVTLPGCQHGRCNVSFECACEPGWKGLFCSEPVCDSDCHPSQGYCERPNECRCRLGWQGPKCKQCAVLPGCLHGTCQGPLECRCDPGWTGFLCQTPICARGCSRENGRCRKPGTCRCRVGWTGPNCTECVAYPGCVHGTCRKPWECQCQAGWTGDLCEEKLTFCDEHPNVCQNNGTCISMTKKDGNYSCICPLGYTGRQCDVEAVEPATDLTPPDIPDEANKPAESIKPELLLDDNKNPVMPDKESTTVVATNLPTPFVNSHQGYIVEGKKNISTLREPLNHTVIVTISPTTIEPAATAGKWPTELPTEQPLTDLDTDNEA